MKEKKETGNRVNKFVLVLAIIVAVIPLINFLIILGRISDMGKITGYATTSTGTANLTVEQSASINFTVATIDWGSGRVHGAGFAILSTADRNVSGGNWTNVSRPLTLENTGNVNVSIKLAATYSAADFIGGTSPQYRWNFTNNESSTSACCYTNRTNITLGNLTNSNTSMMVCNPLEYQDNYDTLRIHFYLKVPSDSITGVRTDTITATATSCGAFC